MAIIEVSLILAKTRIKETSIIATLPGYNFINENSQTQAGGVGAYIKNNLKYLQRRVLQFKIHGCENIWLEILGKRQKIIIGIVYRHPQYNTDEFSQSLSSELPTNYRPISVLTYFSKIFEKVLYGRLNDYFTKNNLLSQQKYGFRNNHFTSLATTDLYENLLHNLNNKLISCAVFLDLRKEFDFGKSFINIENNGPKIDPWVTPEIIECKDDLIFPP